MKLREVSLSIGSYVVTVPKVEQRTSKTGRRYYVVCGELIREGVSIDRCELKGGVIESSSKKGYLLYVDNGFVEVCEGTFRKLPKYGWYAYVRNGDLYILTSSEAMLENKLIDMLK